MINSSVKQDKKSANVYSFTTSYTSRSQSIRFFNEGSRKIRIWRVQYSLYLSKRYAIYFRHLTPPGGTIYDESFSYLLLFFDDVFVHAIYRQLLH